MSQLSRTEENWLCFRNFVKNRFLSLDGKVKNENENVEKKNQKKILHDIHPFETTATDTGNLMYEKKKQHYN